MTGRTPKILHDLGAVPREPLAGLIHYPEVVLRLGVTLLGKRPLLRR